MKEPMVITMAREYASGGSEIAQAVADKLGIPLYNKELITLAAKKSGLTEEAIAASENQRSGSLIYSLYMMGNTMPLADQVYILQSNVIKELAAEGPCVILGRCGDYVLRERPNVLRTFVYAPLETRIQFAKSRPDAKDMPDRLWETQLAKHDRARASYYNYYTENRWGEAKNYDLCLNATLGREACADLIVAAARAMQEATSKKEPFTMLRYVKNGMLLLSVAYIVIGMLLLIMPETSLLWICNIFGVVVLVTGIVCLIQYARIRGTGFTAPFMLVGGVITAGLGIFTLAKPQVVTSFLPIVFGIFIVVDGLSRIGTAIDLAKRKGQKWWLLLLFSIVSVALGVLLVLHPFDAAVSAVMLCGILLIVEGALNLGCILYAAMELRTLDRMASAAANAALGAIGDALDEAEAAERDVGSDGPVVYDAESKDVSEDGE